MQVFLVSLACFSLVALIVVSIVFVRTVATISREHELAVDSLNRMLLESRWNAICARCELEEMRERSDNVRRFLADRFSSDIHKRRAAASSD